MDITITKQTTITKNANRRSVTINQSLDAGTAEIQLYLPATCALGDFLRTGTGIRSGFITISADGTYPLAEDCGRLQVMEVFGLTIFRHTLGYTIAVDLDPDSVASPDKPLLVHISTKSAVEWLNAIDD